MFSTIIVDGARLHAGESPAFKMEYDHKDGHIDLPPPRIGPMYVNAFQNDSMGGEGLTGRALTDRKSHANKCHSGIKKGVLRVRC